jgi:hypothetical protein
MGVLRLYETYRGGGECGGVAGLKGKGKKRKTKAGNSIKN